MFDHRIYQRLGTFATFEERIALLERTVNDLEYKLRRVLEAEWIQDRECETREKHQ